MFRRKPKAPEPVGRSVRRAGTSKPAFSYYTNRVSEGPVERAPERRKPAQEGRGGVRNLFASYAFWVLLLAVVVCAGKVLLLSNDPKVEVVGKTAISGGYLKPTSVYQQAVAKLLDTSVANRSKLTADPEGVALELKHEFPELQDVSIDIPLVSNRPIVYVQPATPSLVLRSTHGDYVLNQSGLTLSSVHTLPAGVVQVVDQSGQTPKPGTQTLPSSTIAFVQMVAFQFKTAKLPINNFILPASAPYELDVRLTGQPYIIRFNLQEDARVQSGAAIGTVQRLKGTVPAQYIDVRTPGRVYYK